MNGIWIRTQENECLVLVKAFGMMKLQHGNMNRYKIFNGDDERTLGIYENKERALKVLDEIQKVIEQSQTIMYEYIHSESTKIEYAYPQKVIYEMPKEVVE